MERIAALSTGTKMMLASSIVLFFDLFLTWQNLPQPFGARFKVTDSLDGWDRWGLVVGLLTLALLAIVVLRETSVELSPEVPWNLITLALGSVAFAVVLLKNVTDAHSALASYAGVILAACMAAGAYLERNRPDPQVDRSPRAQWKPRERVPTSPAPSARSPVRRAATEPEPRTVEPSRRW